MRKLIIALLTSIAITCVSCSKLAYPSVTPTITTIEPPTIQGVPEMVDEHKVVTTPSVIVPTIGPIQPSQESINSQESGLIKNCFDIMSYFNSDGSYSGSIAFETLNPETKYPVSFYDLNTKTINTIKNGSLSYLVVSPDHKLFAFRNDSNDSINVFSDDQELLKTIPWRKNWGGIAGWHDNQTLMIIMDEPESDNSNFARYPRAVTLVDPFTNTTRVLSPSYPDIDKGNSSFGWYRFGTTIYDKTLTKVIYPGTLKNVQEASNNGHNSGYILYSIPEKKELAEFKLIHWGERPPVWSPDGSKLVVMGEDELYLITSSGDTSKVSHMNSGYNTNKQSDVSFRPYLYSWSPDNQSIAMWLKNTKSREITLAILDVNSGIISDTCIPAGYDPEDFSTPPFPVWSPDGKKLVVEANYHPEDRSSDVLLVDIGKKTGSKITSNMTPVGWLILR